MADLAKLDEIRIEEKERETGSASELGPKERARLQLAGWVLVFLFVTVLVALGAVLWAPVDRLADAKEFFSFVKTVVPPLITLVLGFYFNAQGDD
ncbi:MAG: hypothetical protein AB7V26_06440 [Lysobacterales bacterium]